MFALCAFAGDARAGRPEPRLCDRDALVPDPIDRQASDPLRRAARELAQRLLRLDPSVEHGALFYRNAYGTIRMGPLAVGDMHAVQLTVDARRGETLVGALHTHARFAYHTGDQSQLSREDVLLGERLLGLAETDRTLRLYIVDIRQATITEYAAAGRCPNQTRYVS
ncbi:MAG TPA: hypothetical protein VEB23_04895 [Ramlibacter sp.]|nr:hypothetical protein [Ramlibacter sp.]